MPAPTIAGILPHDPSEKIPLLSWGAVAVMVGAVTALMGTYWDDAWHTDIGRDTFWSPPHLVLYAGVALFASGVALWALLVYLQVGSLRGVLREKALVLSLLGAVVTMASAPLDDFWHHAFGRDAVLWSPPHMAGVTGIFTLAAGALLWVSRISGPTGSRLTVMGTAALLATLLAVVFEYESDVPQFPVLWYLPALTGAAALAFSLGHRTKRDPWIATKAALVYTALMLGVVAFLAALGHSNTLIPIIAVPALVFDLSRRYRLPRGIHAFGFASAVVFTYALYLNYVLDGVRVTGMDLVAGFPLGFLTTLVILGITSGTPVPKIRFAPVLVGLAMVGFGASPAYGHDPGQGDHVATLRITATVLDRQAHLVGALLDSNECASIGAAGLVARRAGQEVRATLASGGACRYEGTILLPERGRWFVYLELSRGGERLEAWTPVGVSSRPFTSSRVASLYRPSQRKQEVLQIGAGVALYAVNLMLVGVVIGMFRRTSQSETPFPA